MGRRLGTDKPNVDFTRYPMLRLNTADDGIEYVLAYEDETLPRKDRNSGEPLIGRNGKPKVQTRLVGIVTRIKGTPEKVEGDGEWVPVAIGDVIEERAWGHHKYNPEHETHQGWNPGKRAMEGGYGIGDVVKHTIAWEPIFDDSGKPVMISVGGQKIQQQRKISRYEVRAAASPAELAVQEQADEIDAKLCAEHEAYVKSGNSGANDAAEQVPATVGAPADDDWDNEPF